MIHYSCDRCGCAIDKAQSVRYVVRMEMEATLNVDSEEGLDEDQDCLLEMDEMLQSLHQEFIDEEEPILYQRKNFDLCPACFRAFVKNPVGKALHTPFGFSTN